MSDQSPIYRFDEFELDPAENKLFRAGEVQQLTPKAFQLLCVLVQNHGHVLEKSFLMETIWNESFVEEGNLAFNIRQLRKVLGDDAKAPRFIETVPKRGYRFIAETEAILRPVFDDKKSQTLDDVDSIFRSSKRNIRDRRWIPISFLVILAAGVFFTFGFQGWYGLADSNQSGTTLLSSPFSTERLSSDGDAFHAVLSNNGEFVVYVSGNYAEQQSLRIRDIASGQTRELLEASDAKYLGLKVGHDDSTVYFVRNASIAGKDACLFRVRFLGGLPQELTCGIQGWFDVSEDGRQISIVRCDYSEERFCSLLAADADARNERLLVERPSPERITLNRFAPDGRSIVFAAGQSRDGSADFAIYLYDLVSGKERIASDQRFTNIGGMDWLPGTNTIVMTALLPTDERMYFWIVDSRSGQLSPIRKDDQFYKSVSIDGSGKLFATVTRDENFRIFVHALDGTAKPVPLGRGWSPTFAPDGRVFFSSNRSGKLVLWCADAEGRSFNQISSGSNDLQPVVSPDGKTIFYSSSRNGRHDIWSSLVDGTGAKQLTREEGGFPVAVSPDGSWIFYVSAKNRVLRKLSMDQLHDVQLSKRNVSRIAISKDVQKMALFSRSGENERIEVVSLDTDTVVNSIELPAKNYEGRHLRWSMDGRSLFVVLFDRNEKTNAVWRIAVDGSIAEKLSEIPVEELGERSGFAVSPDETKFVIAFGSWQHNAILVRGLK